MRALRYWPPFAHLLFLVVLVLFVRYQAPPDTILRSNPAAPGGEEHADAPQPDVFALSRQSDPTAMLQLIASRPLFGSLSSVTADAAPEPDAATDDGGDERTSEAELEVQMLGFAEARGERRALLATDGGTLEVWVTNGDVVSGWTVLNIRSDQVTLRQDGRERTINMYR